MIETTRYLTGIEKICDGFLFFVLKSTHLLLHGVPEARKKISSSACIGLESVSAEIMKKYLQK